MNRIMSIQNYIDRRDLALPLARAIQLEDFLRKAEGRHWAIGHSGKMCDGITIARGRESVVRSSFRIVELW
jgi:hypothetical protein